MISDSKLHQAKIIRQIQSCYSNIEKSLDTTISHEAFIIACKESVTEEKPIHFYSEEVIKGFCESILGDLQKSDSPEVRENAEKQLKGLEKFSIVGNHGVPQVVFVETTDVEKGEYLDNAINRHLGRIDIEKSEGSRGGKVVGHSPSGKPIYEGDHHHDLYKRGAMKTMKDVNNHIKNKIIDSDKYKHIFGHLSAEDKNNIHSKLTHPHYGLPLSKTKKLAEQLDNAGKDSPLLHKILKQSFDNESTNLSNKIKGIDKMSTQDKQRITQHDKRQDASLAKWSGMSETKEEGERADRRHAEIRSVATTKLRADRGLGKE